MIPGLVSTIIPVRNRPAMLARSVESVLAQTYPHFEIIISDDGSTDDTVAAAHSLIARFPDRIQLVQGNGEGAGPAREAGRVLARGEFIQYLDSDDELLPTKFELQVAALETRPECGAAYGFIRHVDAAGNIGEEPHKDSGRAHDTLFPQLLMTRWWNTDCPLFRRSVTDRVGAWSSLQYSQDWEYDARVGALGIRLAHCPEWVCVQHSHAETRQTGHGGWLSPSDRVTFLGSLHRCAIRAGMIPGGSAMREFSRWVFFHARYAAEMGDEESSIALFELARSARDGSSLDMMAFSSLARIAGWSRAAHWLGAARALVVKK